MEGPVTSQSLVSGVIGAVLWEVGKQVFGAIIKRRGDRVEGKRKLVRDDIATANERVTECLRDAVDYFSLLDGDARKAELARAVRHSMQTLSHEIRAINEGLGRLQLGGVESSLLISFRRAVTMQLDSVGLQPLPPDDPVVSAMYRAAHHLQLAFAKLRYDAT